MSISSYATRKGFIALTGYACEPLPAAGVDSL
jgi:hypothetical protein